MLCSAAWELAIALPMLLPIPSSQFVCPLKPAQLSLCCGALQGPLPAEALLTLDVLQI